MFATLIPVPCCGTPLCIWLLVVLRCVQTRTEVTQPHIVHRVVNRSARESPFVADDGTHTNHVEGKHGAMKRQMRPVLAGVIEGRYHIEQFEAPVGGVPWKLFSGTTNLWSLSRSSSACVRFSTQKTKKWCRLGRRGPANWQMCWFPLWTCPQMPPLMLCLRWRRCPRHPQCPRLFLSKHPVPPVEKLPVEQDTV